MNNNANENKSARLNAIEAAAGHPGGKSRSNKTLVAEREGMPIALIYLRVSTKEQPAPAAAPRATPSPPSAPPAMPKPLNSARWYTRSTSTRASLPAPRIATACNACLPT